MWTKTIHMRLFDISNIKYHLENHMINFSGYTCQNFASETDFQLTFGFPLEQNWSRNSLITLFFI